MELHEALYTTRAMRRVRPDPIPIDAQARILDAAIRAPSGGNSQPWRFVLVDSPALKAELGPLYRESMAALWATGYKERVESALAHPELPASQSFLKVQRSAQWLADHYEDVPLYLFCFVRGSAGAGGGSIYPAAWSAQLAARAEGIGSALTSVLGASHPAEVRRILQVPDDAWTNSCMLSFGYPTGRWGVAERLSVDKVAARNSWNGDLGCSVPAPLWPSALGEAAEAAAKPAS
ncbi:MAG: nitroreductase family protein [Acidimicrobiales bacterium]|jgi:nitroreductase